MAYQCDPSASSSSFINPILLQGSLNLVASFYRFFFFSCTWSNLPQSIFCVQQAPGKCDIAPCGWLGQFSGLVPWWTLIRWWQCSHKEKNNLRLVMRSSNVIPNMERRILTWNFSTFLVCLRSKVHRFASVEREKRGVSHCTLSFS